MARARNIKPGFFKNDELGECSIYARVLFAGLWCEADPRGIVEDRPKRLKIEILPYDDCNVDSLLSDLVAHGFILRYEVGGVRCIKVTNFSKHQNPHQNEKNNELPDVPSDFAPDHSDVTPVQALEQYESDPALTLTSSLNPSSLNHDSQEKKDLARPSVGTPPDSAKARGRPASNGEECEFERRFYGPYPRHVGKDAAMKAWKRLKPDEQLQAESALQAWLASSAFALEISFVPHPASWLNAGRWKDDVRDVNPPKPIEWPKWIRDRINVHLQECAVNKCDPDPYPVDLRRDMDAYLKSLRVAA